MLIKFADNFFAEPSEILWLCKETTEECTIMFKNGKYLTFQPWENERIEMMVQSLEWWLGINDNDKG